ETSHPETAEETGLVCATQGTVSCLETGRKRATRREIRAGAGRVLGLSVPLHRYGYEPAICDDLALARRPIHDPRISLGGTLVPISDRGNPDRQRRRVSRRIPCLSHPPRHHPALHPQTI